MSNAAKTLADLATAQDDASLAHDRAFLAYERNPNAATWAAYEAAIVARRDAATALLMAQRAAEAA
jgi:hypothetical protein